MAEKNIGEEIVKALFNKELHEKPTFYEEMQEHIKSELQRMVEEYHERHIKNKPTEE